MRTIWLEGDAIRVAVAPEYGARVVSLVDARTGRDWLATGGFSENVGAEAEYLAEEAVGWDECFPNIDRFDAPTPWSRRLRDHGELWGRPWTVTDRAASHLTTHFEHPLFVFTRTLRCTGRTLVADYLLRNRAAETLPFLWAAHVLIAARPGERMSIGEHTAVEAGFLSPSQEPKPRVLDWSGPNPTIGFDLDTVQPIETGFAAKLYVADIASRSVRVGGQTAGLRIGWSLPWTSLGIWLNYGGWPVVGTSHHIALEPTTRPSGICDPGDAAVLAHGSEIEWRITLEIE